MMGTKAKSRQSLERAMSRYEAKLAKATNPTQRQYASNMLRMTKDALDKTREGEPVLEVDGSDVVDLQRDEYTVT